MAPVRIVIIEDDYLIASDMEGALTEAGFDVAAVAHSAEEMLEIAAKASPPPALAVVDIRLSGKRDGIDAAHELLAQHGIRCIFATAHQTPQMRKRAEKAKPLAWIAKPYAMPTLVEAVRHAVRDLGEGVR